MIYYEGEASFYAMLAEVRELGPWTDTSCGEVFRLKPAYRRALAVDNFVLIEDADAVFSPEVALSVGHKG